MELFVDDERGGARVGFIYGCAEEMDRTSQVQMS